MSGNGKYLTREIKYRNRVSLYRVGKKAKLLAELDTVLFAERRKVR